MFGSCMNTGDAYLLHFVSPIFKWEVRVLTFLTAARLQKIESEGKGAVIGFELGKRDHVDRPPRTAFEEYAVGPSTATEFAADAKQRINDDASKRRMILVRRPVHALGDGAVLDAGRRAGTPGTTLVYDSKDVRFPFALVGLTRGDRRVLDDSSCLILLDARSGIRHARPPRMNAASRYFC
jgi:hypothetical protein